MCVTVVSRRVHKYTGSEWIYMQYVQMIGYIKSYSNRKGWCHMKDIHWLAKFLYLSQLLPGDPRHSQPCTAPAWMIGWMSAIYINLVKWGMSAIQHEIHWNTFQGDKTPSSNHSNDSLFDFFWHLLYKCLPSELKVTTSSIRIIMNNDEQSCS